MSLVTRVISATFWNSLRWNRSFCNDWNVRWPSGVTDYMNVGQYRGIGCFGRLTQDKNDLSWWWRSQNEEFTRGSGFLERMSILGAINFSEGGISSRMLGDTLREKLCLAYHVVCLHEFLMRRDTCLDPNPDQNWPLHYPRVIYTRIPTWANHVSAGRSART